MMGYDPNSFKNSPIMRVVEVGLFLVALIVLVLYLSSLRERAESPVSKVIVEDDILEPKFEATETFESFVENEPVPESIPVSSEASSKFIIQIASFSQKDRAEALVQQLRKEDYVSDVQSRDLGDKGTWFRVYVSGFQTEEEAKKVLEILKKEYKDSFIRSL
jgi:cell division septation protein DedD